MTEKRAEVKVPDVWAANPRYKGAKLSDFQRMTQLRAFQAAALKSSKRTASRSRSGWSMDRCGRCTLPP